MEYTIFFCNFSFSPLAARLNEIFRCSQIGERFSTLESAAAQRLISSMIIYTNQTFRLTRKSSMGAVGVLWFCPSYCVRLTEWNIGIAVIDVADVQT